MSTINIHAPLNDDGESFFAGYNEAERAGDVPLRWLDLVFSDTQVTVFLPEGNVPRRQLLQRLRDKVDEAIEAAQKAIIDANHAELTVVRHDVPDPPTQAGCTSCGNDLRHGFVPGDRVVMVAPMTARQHGRITGFSLDKADVVVDGRDYPTTIHTKWLALEETFVDRTTLGELDSRDPAYNPSPDEIVESSVKLARCRCDAPHMDPNLCPAYNLALTEVIDYGSDGDRLVADVLAERKAAEGEAIRRDLARENAYFGRTQGWDPSRPDGE